MKTMIEVLKKNIKAVIGVGLVAIAGFSANELTKKDIIAPLDTVPTPVVDQPATQKINRTYSPKPAPIVAPVDTRGYAELILAYKDHMLQFGASCQVRVSDQNYKIGSEMLLDNRNEVPVTVKIGSSSYALSAYGHQVVTLSTEGKFMVDCNDHQNVATVSVQK